MQGFRGLGADIDAVFLPLRCPPAGASNPSNPTRPLVVAASSRIGLAPSAWPRGSTPCGPNTGLSSGWRGGSQRQNSAPTVGRAQETGASGPRDHRRTCACPPARDRQRPGYALRGKTPQPRRIVRVHPAPKSRQISKAAAIDFGVRACLRSNSTKAVPGSSQRAPSGPATVCSDVRKRRRQ